MPLETVWADSRRDQSRVTTKADVLTGYVRFQDDDVLVPKTAPTFHHGRATMVRGLVNGAGAGSSELHLLRARSGVDPRFLAYVARTEPFIKEGVTAYQGVAGLQRVPADFVADWPVADLTFDDQRRIADFLDDQVARLDQAVSLRSLNAVAIQSKQWAEWTHELLSTEVSAIPLRRVLIDIADGPFGSAFTSDDYTEVGPIVIRLGNIGFAEYKGGDTVSIPPSVWTKFPRCHVKAGELLIAGLGDERNHAGRACVAPDLGPALVKGKCFRAAVDSRLADPTFIALTLSSPLGAELLSVETRGSTRGMINLEIMRSLRVPLPGLKKQKKMVQRHLERQPLLTQLTALNEQSRALLHERKQALITAAVTGQLDVSTARPVGVA